MKKKNKVIGIVVYEFPSISQTFILNQITALCDLGCKVNIYAKHQPNTEIIHSNVYKYNLLKHTTYQVKEPINLIKRIRVFLSQIFFRIDKTVYSFLLKNYITKKQLYNLHLFFRYSLLQKINNIDIFIVHFGMNAIEIAKLKKAGYYKNKKLVIFFHGYDLKPNELLINREQYKDIFNTADYFVVNTPYLKEILIKTKPTLNNIITMPVGLPLPIKTKKIEKYNIFTVVFCGRLINWKGPDKVIEIAEILIKEYHLNINFKIIGDGLMYENLTMLVNEKKLEKHIEMMGALTQEKIFTIYQQSHIFILPGIHDPKTGRAETQGLVIQEAQYFELPVLVSDAGGMKYGLIDGETGYVLRQNDNLSFAKKIKELYHNEDLRIEMGMAGHKFVKEHYDAAKITKNLLNIIDNN